MVHDFMWAADPDYLHDTLKMEKGPTLHFLYKNDPEIIENWKKLQPKTAEAMEFFSKNIGKYPYEQYSVVHGGDIGCVITGFFDDGTGRGHCRQDE